MFACFGRAFEWDSHNFLTDNQKVRRLKSTYAFSLVIMT